ncbi:unnamed protein product [Clonostachys rosea f. rosea IK726]|uniref:DUF2264 domain-containing protein n=2 Tax=Bionectria ochroleuca TaxID=29856 RepID=A0A0B7K8A8_BIOOC|nr:unnamed protein product [Clonostachys rosea f. rosea IK726]
MPSLSGFTDNLFLNRSDMVTAAKALVRPLESYRSDLGGRVKIRPETVAGFDDVAAQLEGFARPLLAIGAFINDERDNLVLVRWMRGLAAGVDPDGVEYWGNMTDFDQRMVETESICLALLTAPDHLLPLLDDKAKANLKTWMWQINQHDMPPNNWRWFRIFVNLTLMRLFNVPRSEVKAIMDADFDLLDSFYIEDGWSSDGKWSRERKQADYYSGSFAMQFAQLMYVRFAVGDDSRVEKYTQQAKDFATNYWRYFNEDGAAIPFGRSLTYRFAFSAFWAAAAVAGIELPNPVYELGAVKGLLLRHLRWWSKHTDIFNSDGILNIGFTYPNMYLCEDYNSPQSVFWCLKTFVVLGLPENHPFWTCEEAPYPGSSLITTQLIKAPHHIVNNSQEHHYLLSSAQMTNKLHKAKDAKYCKFAYSSAFGFSVPTGPSLAQLAPDSTLCVSNDEGDSWKVRNNPTNTFIERAVIGGTEGPVLTSSWRPWKNVDLEIETSLIPISQSNPGWHIRIHRIRWAQEAERTVLADGFQLIDGGFAIPAFTAAGHHIPELSSENASAAEGCLKGNKSYLAKSTFGAGGIIDLMSSSMIQMSVSQEGGNESIEGLVTSEAQILRADPNSNLIHPRTFIPILKHNFVPSQSEEVNISQNLPLKEAWLVSGVFAVSFSEYWSGDVSKLWANRPRISVLNRQSSFESLRFKVE